MSDEIPQREALEIFLAMLAGAGPDLLEVRYRMTGEQRGMGQLFHAASRARSIVETLEGLGRRTDVYVGCAPRTHRHGGAAAIRETRVLWADCDGEESIGRLANFAPRPTFVVRSGTGENSHAYWALDKPLPTEHVRPALRRLAHHLGADMASTDVARILRPPGTLNYKLDPPAPVRCEHLELTTHTVDDLVGELPDAPGRSTATHPASSIDRATGGDALLDVPATIYAPSLTGRQLGTDGKLQCPFHSGGGERTPSLHAYPDDRGWYCFGCEAGGTIIDFGARLYRLAPRGASYHELRRRLATDLLGAIGQAA